MRSLSSLENAVQRVFGGLGSDAAQRVIGAQFDDDGVDFRHQRPVEPFRTGRAGVARHSGIFYHNVVTPGLQGGFQPGRESLLGLKAQARREAVAEGQNM